MAKLVFDLDNTLYANHSSGLGAQITDRVIDWVARELGLTHEAAKTKADAYYAQYAITARGLMLEHPELNIDAFLDYIHTLDCSRLTADRALREMLESFTEQGWELWVMTNGTKKHARNILKVLGVADLFGERLYDCVDQWSASSAPHNKPEKAAYEGFLKRVGHDEMEPIVLIEDSMANLHATAALGWKCVWLSYGSAPRNPAPGVHIIHDVYEMPSVVTCFAAEPYGLPTPRASGLCINTMPHDGDAFSLPTPLLSPSVSPAHSQRLSLTSPPAALARLMMGLAAAAASE